MSQEILDVVEKMFHYCKNHECTDPANCCLKQMIISSLQKREVSCSDSTSQPDKISYDR